MPSGQEVNGHVLEHNIKQVGATVGLLSSSDQPRHRDLYLIEHNTHIRQTSMPPVEFEPAIPASEPRRPTPWTARPLRSAIIITSQG